ncbi:MAG: ABC transporter transmembrane domain-containing protein, partial [Myxococcota bacterium]
MTAPLDPPPRAERTGSGEASLRSLVRLLPFLWPKGSIALRTRVAVALACIAGAKGVGVVVPIFYKQAVDALGADPSALAVPVGAILAYGLARVTSYAFNQFRQIVFERVEQQAIRRAAIRVFEHLHGLPLAFHLRRQTGGLGRSIERGTRAMSSLLSITLFNLIPTALELLLVVGVLWSFFDGSFALVVALTVIGYVIFTISTTEWRLKFRKRLVEADKQASTRAVDSLLNFETVKYFGNERLEVERYDAALRTYEEAAVKSQSSLGVLNLGQSVIIALGLTLLMYMAAGGIVDGTMSVGDFVLVNTYLMLLNAPIDPPKHIEGLG